MARLIHWHHMVTVEMDRLSQITTREDEGFHHHLRCRGFADRLIHQA